jgi:hypothetical protein
MLAIPMAITIIRLVILRNVRIHTKYIKGVGYISTHIDTTHLALFQPSLSLPSCFFFFLSSSPPPSFSSYHSPDVGVGREASNPSGTPVIRRGC